MRQIILFLTFVLFTLGINAQSAVNITINHLLESEQFQNEVQAVNNLDNDFMIDRLQYYLSGFSIIHDGGNVIEIPDHYELISLLDSTDPTTIELGEHNIQNLEGIGFHLGVDYDNNHADPTSWSTDHPLSPKFPSMHWGWAAGYRFIALEGKSGPSIDQEMQFHCIGDEFFLPITFDLEMQNQTVFNINLDAEYANLLQGIDVSNGIILHGSIGEIITLASNLVEEVFSLSDITSTVKLEELSRFTLYPNPSTGDINIMYDGFESNVSLSIYNMLGEEIYSNILISNHKATIENSGIYFAVLSNASGNVLAKSKFIIK
jgi:hypothetical protein